MMRTLRMIIDRLTPMSLRVYYGPNHGSEEYQKLGAYGWGCGRCAIRGEDVGGYTRSLAGARGRAKDHARKHFGMRAVYDEG